MKKLTFEELKKIMYEHNEANNIKQQYSDKNPLIGVVVITEDTFGQKYSLESRSYEFRSDEKYFIPEMLGNSIFANSLAKDDMGVRLDNYIFDGWDIDYCYIKE